jgi:hypothetical protein
LVSALIAALALSVKLTAALALVVPFLWLLQRAAKSAWIWGVSVLTLTVLGSILLPGWSWATMGASHLNFAAKEIWIYRFDPAVYVHGWLVSALAIFAIANRYVTNRLAPVVPWLCAALVALLIHLVHRPFWDYYMIHLMTPMAALAGVGVVDLWQELRTIAIPRLERKVIIAGSAALCIWWGLDRVAHVLAARNQATVLATSPVTKELKSLGESGHTVFAMNPSWTFAAHQVQTPVELTVVPFKRIWSGQLTEVGIVGMLASNHVDAVVLSQATLKQSAWSNFLAGYCPTARDGPSILFVRRELNPKPIDLGKDNISVRDLGL